VKNLTIRHRIIASFALLLVLMLVMTAVQYSRLMEVGRFAKSMETDSLPGLNYSGRITLARLENYAMTQELVLQPDPAVKQQLRSQILASRTAIDALVAGYTGTLQEVRDRAMLDHYMAAQSIYRAAQDEIIALDSDPVRREEVLKRLNTHFRAEQLNVQNAATALVDQNAREAALMATSISDAVSGAEEMAVSTMGIALLLAFASGYYILRRITDEISGLIAAVQHSGTQVGASVTEIATTAKEHQATASEIAATTTEIGATSREISDTSRRLVATMTEVSGLAGQSAALAGQGQDGLAHMEGTMRRVTEAAASINAKLAVLNDKAGNISQVVTTITKVADQTNLLSLNASIEAEKAGDYGRGFAVVATEIRRLADQTAVATYDIEQMVKEIQSAVSAGVMGMDKFSEEVRRGMVDVQQVGQHLSQVIHHVQALAPRVEAVNDGVRNQANGAEQITQALGQLGEAAQQTVDSLRQSASAIDELKQVASDLRGGVSKFTVQVA
jgi:methyl-accepting chemotaxis protein WspA